MSLKSCDRCRFASKDPANQLWCRLLPPRPLLMPNGTVAHILPAVGANWWCSGFKLALKRLFRGHGGT